VELSKVF